MHAANQDQTLNAAATSHYTFTHLTIANVIEKCDSGELNEPKAFAFTFAYVAGTFALM